VEDFKVEKLKSRIFAIQAEITENSATLDHLKSNLNSVLVEYWKAEYGIAVGVIVRHQGVESRVVHVKPGWSDKLAKPRIKVNRRNKNGSWGARVFEVYGDYELVDKNQTEL